MVYVNSLVPDDAPEEIDVTEEYFPHIWNNDKDFYCERRGDDLYVETVLNTVGEIKARLLEFRLNEDLKKMTANELVCLNFSKYENANNFREQLEKYYMPVLDKLADTPFSVVFLSKEMKKRLELLRKDLDGIFFSKALSKLPQWTLKEM